MRYAGQKVGWWGEKHNGLVYFVTERNEMNPPLIESKEHPASFQNIIRDLDSSHYTSI